MVKSEYPAEKRRRAFSVFVITLFHSLSLSLAGAGQHFLTSGQAGYSFLKVPVSARAVGLGEAFVGWAGDASALDYNPATIAAMTSVHLAVSHVLYFEDSALSAVSAAGGWGRTGLGVAYRQFLASDEARDVSGNRDGDIDHRSAAAELAVARHFGRRLGLGVGVKNISAKIERSAAAAPFSNFDVKNSAWALDLGFLFALHTRGTLGFSVQNIGTGTPYKFDGVPVGSPFGTKTEGAREPLPVMMRLGGVHPVGPMSFSWELMQPRDGRVLSSAGAEVHAASFLVLRGGLRYQRYIDVAAGFGVEKGFFSFDYGFSPRVDLGSVHRATLGLRF